MSAGSSVEVEARPQRRPVRAAAIEVGAMVVTLILCIGLVVARYPGGEGPAKFAAWAGKSGEVLLSHIDGTLAVYVATLLAFYALVVGKQMVDAPRFAARTRRVLGYVAEIMAASLVPGLVLVIAACFRRPELAGALFAVIPVTGLVFFFALQLGSFAIVEDDLRREYAQDSLEWASTKLLGLHSSSKRMWALTFGVNAAVFGILGLIVGTIVNRGAPTNLSAGFLVALLSAGLGLIVTVIHMSARFLSLTSKDAAGRLLSLLMSILLWLSVAAAVLGLLADWSREGMVGMIVLVVVTLVASMSAYWSLRKVPEGLGWWATASVAQGVAATELERVRRQSERTLRELAPVVEPVEVVVAEPDNSRSTPRALRFWKALQELR